MLLSRLESSLLLQSSRIPFTSEMRKILHKKKKPLKIIKRTYFLIRVLGSDAFDYFGSTNVIEGDVELSLHDAITQLSDWLSSLSTHHMTF